MGGCNSKKAPTDIKTRKDKGQKALPPQAEEILEKPVQEEKKDEKIGALPVKDATPAVKNDFYQTEFLESCFKGEDKNVLKLIKQHAIIDIGKIRGFKTSLTLGIDKGRKTYRQDFISEWNPLLLAISQKQIKIVRLLFEKVKSFHKINCMAKPYNKELQKEKIYDHNKRLKRECFALKLAVLNYDEDTFKFLWNDHRLFWNLGHFFICAQLMVKNSWEQGLKIILSSTSTKVYFMSVNNIDDFVDTVDLIRDELIFYESINKEMAQKFIDQFDIRPYFIYNYFLEFSGIADQTKKRNFDKLNSYLERLNQDDIQFSHADINEIFRIFDEQNLFANIKDQFFAKYEDKDQEKNEAQLQLIRYFQNEKLRDEQGLNLLLEDMDLFAFLEIKVNGEETNSLVETFKRGFFNTMEYIFNDGFVNVRAILKKNNKFETYNEVAQFNTCFFTKHLTNKATFTTIYNYIIDLMQLSNMLEVFDTAMELKVTEIFNQVLHDLKFRSLFESSLELQKFIFTREVIQMAEFTKQKQIINWLKEEPYLWYYNQIKNKNNDGSEYADRTIKHLQRLAENREETPGVIEEKMFTKTKEDQYQEIKDLVMNEQLPRDTKERRSVRPSYRPTYRPSVFPKEEFMEVIEEEVKTPEKSPYKVEKVPSPELIIQELKKQQPPPEPKVEVKTVIPPQPVYQKVEEKPIAQIDAPPPKEDSIQFQDDFNDYDEIHEEAPPENNFVNPVVDQSQRVYQMQPNKFDQSNINLEKSELIDYDHTRAKDNFENLPALIIDCIKVNDINKMKQLIKKYNIRNVTWLKQYDAEPLKVKGNGLGNSGSRKNLIEPAYDTALWNPVLYSIYYQRMDILRMLIEEYSQNFILALRLPPVNEYSEYIIPAATPNDWQNNQNSKVTKGQPLNDDESEEMDPFSNSPGEYVAWQGYASVTKQGPTQFYYNPSDARIECFGLELAIRNRDLQILRYLWCEQLDRWDERHFSFVFDKVLQENWDQGIDLLFKSKTANVIFRALNPEDKDNFLNSKIIDKISDTEFWENAKSPIKISPRLVQLVVNQLKLDPYGPYSVLKFPILFLDHQILESTLQGVTFDDIYDFAVARKENIVHFQQFLQSFQSQITGNSQQIKTLQFMTNILKKAQEILTQQRRLPPNPEKIVQLIKLGDLDSLKRYFSRDDNSVLLELLNQHSGYEDSDYLKVFQNNVKTIPADDTIQLLLAENSTMDWNPLIFAIFYQKHQIVEFFCDHPLVYVRNCLTTPFIIETNEDPENEEEEKFIREKTELFCLVLCIMLQNREIFRYLWKRCSFLWNDIHLVLLANYVFDSQWQEGIKSLFHSACTHQIFNAMNYYEKEKFLKFCEKSLQKTSPNMIKDFRYHMSFDPYNIYYLPIIASPEEIQFWEQDPSKELFFKTCLLNFDERSFAMLNSYNDQFVIEYISQAITVDSEQLRNFAKKLQRYLSTSSQRTLM